MVEFLKLDLENYYQNATIRMIDEPESRLAISQAHFSTNGAVLEHLFTDHKPNHFRLSPDEMDALAVSWLDYRAAVAKHKAAEEARKITIEQEARELIEANRFDYEPLNITLKEDPNYSGWRLEIAALGTARQNIETLALPKTVKEMLDNLKERVKYAEDYGWKSDDWQKIIASYRRKFPKDEPAEIQEARRLLKERLHPADWAQCAIHPGTTPNAWSFDNGQEGRHFALFNNTPAEILEFIRRYAPFGAADLEAMHMDQSEQGEPSEQELDIAIEQALLEESSLPVSEELEHEYYP